MPRLNVGDKMPNFEFNTAYEDNLTIDGILKGKTVIWVLRYIGCTVCRYDVKLLTDRYEEFTNQGAQVLVLMQSDQEHVRNDFKNSNSEDTPVRIICDPELKIYKALDILPAASMEELAGDADSQAKLKEKGGKAREAGFVHGDYEGDEQQLPALFVLDSDGVVLYSHYAKNIMDMPTIDEVLAII